MLGQAYLSGQLGGERANPLTVGMNALQNSANAGMSLIKLLQDPTRFNNQQDQEKAITAAQLLKNQYMPQHFNDQHQTSLANLLGRQIQNQYAPQLLSAQAKQAQFKANNPDLYVPQSLAETLRIAQQHPELIQSNNQSMNQAPKGSLGANQAPQNSQPQSLDDYVNNYVAQQASGVKGSTTPLSSPNPLVNAFLQKNYSTRPNYGAYRLKMAPWRAMPAQDRAQALAIARGMGVDGTQASKFFSNGGSLDNLAQHAGVKISDVDPIYSLGTTTKNNLQQRKVALAGVNSLSKNITEAMAPYSRKFLGYSPSQIVLAISNEDPGKQAKYLAGLMLSPELGAARARAFGGLAGEGLVNEIQNKSMLNGRTFQALVSPEVFTKAQKLADAWIQQSFKKEVSAVNNPYKTRLGKLDYKNSSGQEKSNADSDPLGIM